MPVSGPSNNTPVFPSILDRMTIPEASSPLAVRSFRAAIPEAWPVSIYDYELRKVEISNHGTFEIRAPKFWSNRAVKIFASHYCQKVPRMEHIDEAIRRIVVTLNDAAIRLGYIHPRNLDFKDNLSLILTGQFGTFNSPVWYNLGVSPTPQGSACFINSVEDTMESIIDLVAKETRIFKQGSGSGADLSALRASSEKLSSGGFASGPVSFMAGFDAMAGVIKSGGKNRRAAKMVTLFAGHPDIKQFIRCKALEQEKTNIMIANGVSNEFDSSDSAAASVRYQNANNAVRLSDDFMRAALDESRPVNWNLTARTTGEVLSTVCAADLFDEIAAANWFCGDPGVHFSGTINDWRTFAGAEINSSNPCSEYLFIDDSACNLACLRVTRFRNSAAETTLDPAMTGPMADFLLPAYEIACQTFTIAMDILVAISSYPTEMIRANSIKYRPLGLGMTDLGALLLAEHVPYDSTLGQMIAGSLQTFMTATVYAQSQTIASHGLIQYDAGNAPSRADEIQFRRVLAKHEFAAAELSMAATEYDSSWAHMAAVAMGTFAWLTNSETAILPANYQATLAAPNGTTGLALDCETTGIEPFIAYESVKSLVGGGYLVDIPETPKRVARDYFTTEIIAALEAGDITFGDLPHSTFTRSLFGASLEPGLTLSANGHIRMLGALQPHLSGAISKTVNLPADATEHDIRAGIEFAYKLGVKAITFFRSGCKSGPIKVKSDSAPQEVSHFLKCKKCDCSVIHRTGVCSVCLHCGTSIGGC